MRNAPRSFIVADVLLKGSLALAAEPSTLTISLNHLDLGLDRDSGALVHLAYPSTGTILDARGGEGGPLDVACPVKEFVPLRLGSRFSHARIDVGDRVVTIDYGSFGSSRSHVSVPGGKVTAQVQFKAADDGRSVVLSCSIENHSSAAIPQILFPDLQGLRPFEGVEGTLFRMTNGVIRPFTGPARPTEGAPYYAFQDGWKVCEYGGYYGPHVLRWIDLGGYRGGLSLFERQWGGTNIPNLLLQRVERDPQSLRVAWEHRVTIPAGGTWKSAEFWLTPHAGGLARGIEVFRAYVQQVNPPRQAPRHIREGLGFQTPWMIQGIETDPARAAFRYTDLPRIAADARAHGIDELCLWGPFAPFQLPIDVDPRLGTQQEYLDGIRQARALQVNCCPFISVALLKKESLQPFGITQAAPSWIYHPDLIRNLDPYYQKSGVVGW